MLPEPPQEVLQAAAARRTQARAHTPLGSDLAVLPPLPKPDPGHLLKDFCKSSLFQQGLGAELSCVHSV